VPSARYLDRDERGGADDPPNRWSLWGRHRCGRRPCYARRLTRPVKRPVVFTTIAEANRKERFLPEHNARFAVPAAEQTSVFIPYAGRPFEDPVRSGNPPEPAPVKAIDAGELV
jgi:hypothetical protein